MLDKYLVQTIDFLSSGGGVIWPLLGLSLIMWALIIKKMLEFYTLRSNESSFQECWQAALKDDQSVGAPWQREFVQTISGMKSKLRFLDMSMLVGLEKRQEQRIDKYIKSILVLAGIAPLLGLLGTVCGMISTFEVIAWFGTGNAKAMASGISEALITTQAGLLVAVPGLVLGSFLQRRAEELKSRIHRFCLGFLREANAYSHNHKPG
ncbi:MAG TPA: MotA/TolQ/ExbB proton channel family protein [Desulfohalobiaceae bacterium]|nr:MotA/TolQ/ExbB proton channel family protein [Desulfohalobiaceae bacterium]